MRQGATLHNHHLLHNTVDSTMATAVGGKWIAFTGHEDGDVVFVPKCTELHENRAVEKVAQLIERAGL